jgi:cytoskeletal protein RodZ
MAQLSRPYQIALGAVVVLGLIWAVALRAHGSNPSEPAPTSPAASTPAPASTAKSASSATSAAAEAKAAAAPTPIYHGAAPGVEGLTRAIAKAHGAVATSQQNAQQLQSKSAEASQG